MQQKLHAAKAHSVFRYPLSPSTPSRPHLQASEKLHSPIGLLKIHVRTSLCGREMASEPNILKRDGGALSSGNSTLMQRERGKKRSKSQKKKAKVRAVGKIGGPARGRGGPDVGRESVGKSGGKRRSVKGREGASQATNRGKQKVKRRKSRHQS